MVLVTVTHIKMADDLAADLEANAEAIARKLIDAVRKADSAGVAAALDAAAAIEGRRQRRQGTETDPATEPVAIVNARDARGRTALYVAAQNGHTDIVKLLLEAGADTELFGRRVFFFFVFVFLDDDDSTADLRW